MVGTASAVNVKRVHSILSTPHVSVVVTTYNRSKLLAAALRSILAQQDAATPPFELIVVDNNSSDDTCDVVLQFAAVDPRVRYVFEGEQGSSCGRNAGIRAARAPIIAFTDDDVRAAPNWLAAIARTFAEHPDADVVGGRVLPLWPSPPPDWLTRAHWMPLALIDYGDAPLAIDAAQPICLVTANCAFRRRVFDAVGVFSREFQLGNHGILGSVEDHELQLRVLRAGAGIRYDPRIIVQAEVQPNRLERRYHRRWHSGHGHFVALMHSEEMEHTRLGTLLGVPAHLYGQAGRDLVTWACALARRDRERAFVHELRLRFFAGFFATRRREFARQPIGKWWYELRRLIARTPSQIMRRPRVAEGK